MLYSHLYVILFSIYIGQKKRKRDDSPDSGEIKRIKSGECFKFVILYVSYMHIYIYSLFACKLFPVLFRIGDGLKTPGRPEPSYKYPMNIQPHGSALIINNVNYHVSQVRELGF